MSYYVENLQYSLAKRVPSMDRGFQISTNYGEIHIDSEEGQAIITAVRKLLERKLARAEKHEAEMRKAIDRKLAEGGAA